MATKNDAPLTGEVVPVGQGPQLVSPAMVEAYENMLTSIPDAGGEGIERILAQIAGVTDPRDLDAPWRTAGLDKFMDELIEIRGIRKLPSDYGSGLPWFLVLDIVYKATGELLTATTGAVMVVAQLAKAYQLGAFPIGCYPRQSERAEPGKNPAQHLEIIYTALDGKAS